MINVLDTNLANFSIVSGTVEGGVLTPNENDMSLYVFTWTPSAIIDRPIVFVATDEMGASFQYEPRVEFCQCRDESECTLQGVLNQLANPVDLECICLTGAFYV